MKPPVVLFFINGSVPTPEQAAEGYKMQARFRNAALITRKDEHADFVYGEIPECYADVPRYGGQPEAQRAPEDGEQVGDYFLHQIERGKWNVLDEDGNVINEQPLNKADARDLALEHSED